MYTQFLFHLQSSDSVQITLNKTYEDNWVRGDESHMCLPSSLSCEQTETSGSDLDKARGGWVIVKVTQVNYCRCEVIAGTGSQNNLISDFAEVAVSTLRLMDKWGTVFFSSFFENYNFSYLWKMTSQVKETYTVLRYNPLQIITEQHFLYLEKL